MVMLTEHHGSNLHPLDARSTKNTVEPQSFDYEYITLVDGSGMIMILKLPEACRPSDQGRWQSEPLGTFCPFQRHRLQDMSHRTRLMHFEKKLVTKHKNAHSSQACVFLLLNIL